MSLRCLYRSDDYIDLSHGTDQDRNDSQSSMEEVRLPSQREPIFARRFVCLAIVIVLVVFGMEIHSEGTFLHADPSHIAGLSYSGGWLAITLNGARFGIINYVIPLLQYANAGASTHFRQGMVEWYSARISRDNPSVATGPGENTKMYLNYNSVKQKLIDCGPLISNGSMKRESELALVIFNDGMWPEVGKFALGFSTPDHAIVRPYLAWMFDNAQNQLGGWTSELLRQEFKLHLDNISSFANCNSQSCRFGDILHNPEDRDGLFLTLVFFKVLHKVALGLIISDVDARQLATLQTQIQFSVALPTAWANIWPIWHLSGEKFLAARGKYIDMYKKAILGKWPGHEWPDRKLALLASAVLDVMLFAGGRGVPTALDLVLGYMLSKNRPAALATIDFEQEDNLLNLLLEVLRYHPPVTTLPRWITTDGGASWQHEHLNLDRALADHSIFPHPDTFILGRPGLNSSGYDKSMAWADFALVNGDNAHPHSHACPAKNLSINMVLAFVREFQVAGPWEVRNDDIKFYGGPQYTSGFEVVKRAHHTP